MTAKRIERYKDDFIQEPCDRGGTALAMLAVITFCSGVWFVAGFALGCFLPMLLGAI